jgi:diguanylate cyclase (GGDEF)-like protein
MAPTTARKATIPTAIAPVQPLLTRGIALLHRATADAHPRHAALLIVGAICALASLGIAAMHLFGASPPAWLGTIAILQLTVVACVVDARWSMARHLRTLSELVESDPATGCLNRRGFARALDEALATAVAGRSDVAVLSIDLDHFKQINDRYGHNVGDLVLSEVAAALAETVGAEGAVARLGGEEFMVLLPGGDAETAGVLAERMMVRLHDGCCGSLAPGSVVTMSVGIAAERVSSARDGAALRARADEALYMAKREGRNRVLLWAPGVRSMATPHAAMVVIASEPRWPRTRP